MKFLQSRLAFVVVKNQIHMEEQQINCNLAAQTCPYV